MSSARSAAISTPGHAGHVEPWSSYEERQDRRETGNRDREYSAIAGTL